MANVECIPETFTSIQYKVIRLMKIGTQCGYNAFLRLENNSKLIMNKAHYQPVRTCKCMKKLIVGRG